MPKYQINVNAYGHSAGDILDGEPDPKLVAAGIFTLIGEVEDGDQQGEPDSGADGGDTTGADKGSGPGTE